MKPLKFLINIIKMKKFVFITACISFLFIGCKSSQSISSKDDGVISFKIIQLNDVYEIAPLSGGQYGGMARVAHIRDSVQQLDPNTYMVLAGDFLNPSLLGTIKYNGERIYGKQMVEVMNAMNFDLVTFGNHEFDVTEEGLQKRLNESNFPWITANVRHIIANDTVPFEYTRNSEIIPVPDTFTLYPQDKDGTKIEVGFVSVTIPSNPQPFVYYGDIFKESKRAYSDIKSKADIVLGLTHVSIDQDKEISNQNPGIAFIMGGHEHNNMLVESRNAKITKADANAKTVYIHTFSYNKKTKKLDIDSELLTVDNKIASKPSVEVIVEKWTNILETEIKQVISNPNEIIYNANPPLDGTDSSNRSKQTNLGEIITNAMALSFTSNVDAGLVNGGSIRIDDMMEGNITSMDVFRVLPFGGGVLKVNITGSLLKEVLDYSVSKSGTGAYLQRYNISKNPEEQWIVGSSLLDENNTYTVAFSDFLLKGYDIPFLTPDNKGVLNVYSPTKEEAAYDIRKAVILYIKSLKK